MTKLFSVIFVTISTVFMITGDELSAIWILLLVILGVIIGEK